MTVLLVIATVAIFLVIEHFYGKQPAVVEAATETRTPRPVPQYVSGFRVPENLLFHPGHAWALSESPNLVRVGVDDMSARLFGKVTRMTLPQRGQWVRQGQKIFSMERDGMRVDMLCPIEGTVTEINDSVLRDPDLSRRDPYGEGWLLKVDAPDAKTNFRNLLGASTARSWTADAAKRIQKYIPAVLDAVAADGGIAIPNIAATLSTKDKEALAHEIFLV